MSLDLDRRRLLAIVLSATALAGAQAADKPPMRIIVPASAGSGIDTILRAAGPSLQKALGGQAIVIENLPGAGGITGTAILVKAAPDGNTIALVARQENVIHPLSPEASAQYFRSEQERYAKLSTDIRWATA